MVAAVKIFIKHLLVLHKAAEAVIKLAYAVASAYFAVLKIAV